VYTVNTYGVVYRENQYVMYWVGTFTHIELSIFPICKVDVVNP